MSHKCKKYWPLMVLLGIAVFFLVGFITQLLWNATISVIFDASRISYWQAIMLIVLSKILFSSHYKVHRKIKHHHSPFVKRETECEDQPQS